MILNGPRNFGLSLLFIFSLRFLVDSLTRSPILMRSGWCFRLYYFCWLATACYYRSYSFSLTAWRRYTLSRVAGTSLPGGLSTTPARISGLYLYKAIKGVIPMVALMLLLTANSASWSNRGYTAVSSLVKLRR